MANHLLALRCKYCISNLNLSQHHSEGRKLCTWKKNAKKHNPLGFKQHPERERDQPLLLSSHLFSLSLSLSLYISIYGYWQIVHICTIRCISCHFNHTLNVIFHNFIYYWNGKMSSPIHLPTQHNAGTQVGPVGRQVKFIHESLNLLVLNHQQKQFLHVRNSSLSQPPTQFREIQKITEDVRHTALHGICSHWTSILCPNYRSYLRHFTRFSAKQVSCFHVSCVINLIFAIGCNHSCHTLRCLWAHCSQ